MTLHAPHRVPTGVIAPSADEVGRVLVAVTRRYAAVIAGTSDQHADARQYFGGMLACACWVAGVMTASPLHPDGGPLPVTAASLDALIPAAGLATRGLGSSRVSRHYALGVMGMLEWVTGTPAGRSLTVRLGMAAVAG